MFKPVHIPHNRFNKRGLMFCAVDNICHNTAAGTIDVSIPDMEETRHAILIMPFYIITWMLKKKNSNEENTFAYYVLGKFTKRIQYCGLNREKAFITVVQIVRLRVEKKYIRGKIPTVIPT